MNETAEKRRGADLSFFVAPAIDLDMNVILLSCVPYTQTVQMYRKLGIDFHLFRRGNKEDPPLKLHLPKKN